MTQAVWIAAIIMTGLVLITIIWQVLEIGKGKALQEGAPEGVLRRELTALEARVSEIEARGRS